MTRLIVPAGPHGKYGEPLYPIADTVDPDSYIYQHYRGHGVDVGGKDPFVVSSGGFQHGIFSGTAESFGSYRDYIRGASPPVSVFSDFVTINGLSANPYVFVGNNNNGIQFFRLDALEALRVRVSGSVTVTNFDTPNNFSADGDHVRVLASVQGLTAWMHFYNASTGEYYEDSGAVTTWSANTGAVEIREGGTEGWHIVTRFSRRIVPEGMGEAIVRDPYNTLFRPANRPIYFIPAAGGPTYTLTANSGTYTISGTAAALTASRAITATAGAYSASGTDAALTYQQNNTLTADSGTYTTAGTAADLVASRALPADSGSYTVSGTSVTLRYGYILSVDSGAYAATGTAVDLTASRAISADSGVYTYNGTAVTLTYSGQSVWTVQPGASTTWTVQTPDDTTWTVQ